MDIGRELRVIEVEEHRFGPIEIEVMELGAPTGEDEVTPKPV